MILPATQSKLQLLMPQHNKVLNELIKYASPEQLATLNDKKDLKSLLGMLFTHKIDNTKSDTLLLNMLKNSPAFKNMGNFTESLKSLISDLKSNPSLANNADKLLRATHPIQSDTIGQKVITMLESEQSKINPHIKVQTAVTSEPPQSKLNPQPNPLLKPEISIPSDKHVHNVITTAQHSEPEIKNLLANEIKTVILNSSETQENISSPKETPLQTQNIPTATDLEETKPSPDFNLDAPILKEKIINSGIFMESKIATLEGATPKTVEEQMGNDVKSQLLELHEQLQASPSLETTQLQQKIDELLTHIDYHQLLSHLNNSNSLYFPFAWDGLEKGSLEFKHNDGEKSYCQINLTLKEYGEIDLFMGLHNDTVLDIKIHTQTTQFKQLLETNIDELRTLMKEANLTLRSVRIFDENERLTQSVKAYETPQDETYDGFEVTI